MSNEIRAPESMLDAIIEEMEVQEEVLSDSEDEAARVVPITPIRPPRDFIIRRRIAVRTARRISNSVRRALFVEDALFEQDTQTAIRISMRDYKPRMTTTTIENINKVCPELNARHQKDKCTVCLENLKRGDKMRQLPCFHYLHSECLVGWFTRGNTVCPVCRYEVKFNKS